MGIPLPWDLLFAPEAKAFHQEVELDPFPSLRESFIRKYESNRAYFL